MLRLLLGKEVQHIASLSSCEGCIARVSDKADKVAISNVNEVAACGSDTEDTYMNQAQVLSPESSPSSAGQTRSITVNNPNQGSGDMIVKCTAKRFAECLMDEGKDGKTPPSIKRQQIICAANWVISQIPLVPAKE